MGGKILRPNYTKTILKTLQELYYNTILYVPIENLLDFIL